MPPGSVNATIIRMNGMTDPYDGAFLRAEGFFRNSFVTEWQQRIMYFFSLGDCETHRKREKF